MPTGSGVPERVAQPAGVLDGDPALLAGDPHPDRPAGLLQLRPARLGVAPRCTASAVLSGPSTRSRSATPSTSRARRSSDEPLQLAGEGRRSRRGRAGRAARRSPAGRAARPAASGPGTGPARGARPAVSRPRRGTARRSRTAATGRTATAAAVSTSTKRTARVLDVAHQRRPARARRRRPAGTRAPSRARPGTSRTRWPPRAAAPSAAAAATAADRRPGLRRGSSRARAAHSRNRDANSADPPTSAVTSGSTSSGSTTASSVPVRWTPRRSSSSTSGSRSTMPSSACIACTSTPYRSRSRAATRQRPRRVHLRPERRVDRHPPVAELVAEPLDDDRAVVGQVAGRLRAARRGRRAGCRPPSASSPAAITRSRASPAVERRRARGRRRRPRGPARPAGRGCRPSRTAAARAGPARG